MRLSGCTRDRDVARPNWNLVIRERGLTDLLTVDRDRRRLTCGDRQMRHRGVERDGGGFTRPNVYMSHVAHAEAAIFKSQIMRTWRQEHLAAVVEGDGLAPFRNLDLKRRRD